jgi:hypothetical protein
LKYELFTDLFSKLIKIFPRLQIVYGKVLFIVASNGMEWTKKNMPKEIIVKYIQGTTETDLAMLASCDHVVMFFRELIPRS